MFSSTSFAEWTGVVENVNGTFYVDFERVRKVDGYVYWWEMSDRLKPTKFGDLSDKAYYQGDCKLFRYKVLSFSTHKEPMGRGTPSTSSNKPEKDWDYPPPNTGPEMILKTVCDHVK